MSFEDEIRKTASLARRNNPGFNRTIDKIVEDFQNRKDKGEFKNWDLGMITEDFLIAVSRKCVKVRPFKSSKSSRK